MNAKVMAVISLAVVALVVLYLYSFGPLAAQRHSHQANPQSLKPTPAQGAATGTSEYNNKDLKENYYRVAFSKAWQVKPGTTPGSYLLSFGEGKATVGLVDVPDNSTLELFVLSQEEPRLKKEVAGYQRKSYRKLTVNGAEAHELVYSGLVQGVQSQCATTWIAGADMAGTITVTVPQNEAATPASIMDALTGSFRWENQ